MGCAVAVRVGAGVEVIGVGVAVGVLVGGGVEVGEGVSGRGVGSGLLGAKEVGRLMGVGV